jgi:basic amino acid/polyamine antiporter, APA family
MESTSKLKKKYGLFTAICMVVGIVIGSGVFFKAQTILQKTDGDLPLGILAWIIGGVIMLVCVLTFAMMAQKYVKVNGLVDYAEATVGSKYAYYVGWFSSTIYNPTLTGVLCWLSARYLLVFITSCWPDFPLVIPAAEGGCAAGPECLALTMFIMCCAYFINAISPKLAGKLQTSMTIIKLIPLGLMAVVGIIAGLVSPTHMLVNNFAAAASIVPGETSKSALLLAAVCSTAFAYEGWIIATSINSELEDAKKNMPRALTIGGIIIMAVYIAYYVGVAGGASVESLMADGATVAFTNIFGGVLGNILNLFIAISCIGTTNGLMLACTRGMYSLAIRGEGPRPQVYSQVDAETNMPNNAAAFALLVTAFWAFYFYIASVACTWSGAFIFDASELPIVTIYAMYIPVFIAWMKKETQENALRRYVLPALGVVSCLFMVYACIVGHGIENVWYLIVFAAFMFVGWLVNRKNKKLN